MDPLPSSPILIVEDDIVNGQLLVDLLELDGYTTQLVHSGRAAMEVLQHGLRPRALVLDYHLFDMNAAQLLAATVAERVGVPVLIVTADHTGKALAQRLDVAWVGFKPLDLEELLAQLATALADQ